MSTAVIDVQNLAVRLAGKPVLRDVSFTVGKGEILGLLGPNGAGKSTTAECLTGALRPESGRVRVSGLDPHRHPAETRKTVGYQLQSAQLPPALRVREAIELFASFYPAPQDVPVLLDAVGLGSAWATPYGRLSGGQQQRLSIALALVGNPRIVVLDELTTGLDPEGRRDILHLIRRMREEGLSVVLITHFMDEAQRLCDRVAVIYNGRTFAAGTPQELVAAARRQDPAVQDLADAYLGLLETQRRNPS
ncbi:ABC transporter ATP-binding protein [Arthrobacter sp. Sa2CUA1]|uniref:ABC transporter ATP-binding protein n=1 Tax=Arthrobacter gallicola TaxID=2762225 RepID=A0ABR8UN93_9MICC|nr:ABC transporter ATP-binding protein [Arthrobacter gallicola]MBD7994013.1 ABC transporter ATP-binding protein [Arthrobacter gallicola]